MMTEMEQRKLVVEEALSWKGTPYHHQGFIKGAGVDCAFILIKVFHECGLIPDIDPRPYPMDWHLHRGEQRYLGWVEQYAKEVTDREPLPGDVVLYRFGRCISHGAIVVEWPIVIHSYVGQGVVLADSSQPPLNKRQQAIYSVWG